MTWLHLHQPKCHNVVVMVILLRAPFQEEVVFENVDQDGNPVPLPEPLFFEVLNKRGQRVYLKTSGIEVFGPGNSRVLISFSEEETSMLARSGQALSYNLFSLEGRTVVDGTILAFFTASQEGV